MNDVTRFGYYLHSSALTPALGHAGLDVYLTNPPQTERFFDTARAVFTVFEDDESKRLHVLHPSLRPNRRYQVLPGRFFIEAHDGDLVEGLCFGGELTVEINGGYTVAHLVSPAPIFDFGDPDDAMNVLDEEMEAELARLRAQWHGGEHDFVARIAQLDPQTLLVTALHLAQRQLQREQNAYQSDETAEDLTGIRYAIHALRRAGEWPEHVSSLGELMGIL